MYFRFLILCFLFLFGCFRSWTIGMELVLEDDSTFPEREHFVWPGNGMDLNRRVWGHAKGLQIGLWEGKSPQGLMLVRAPYLDLPKRPLVNFLSIEPSVEGSTGRGQSELEMSRHRPGERGLSFYASDTMESYNRNGPPATGIYDQNKGTLTVYVHTEPFKNGIDPVIRLRFYQSQPYEVEISTFSKKDSAKISYCTISATMGNFSILRKLHLNNGRVIEVADLWKKDESSGKLGFLKWKSFPISQMEPMDGNRVRVSATSNFKDAADIKYPVEVGGWKYEGILPVQYWIASADSGAVVAVNARRTYWSGIPPRAQLPIPGGASFENFELRIPYKEGQTIWFGVEAMD